MGYLNIKRPPLHELMVAPVAACARAHSPAPGWSVALSIATPFKEIVDVQASGTHEPMRACVVEAAWALALPAGYRAKRANYRADFS
jgi:hypothetical protein